MEKEGFSRCIEMLESKNVTISRIATDHHVSISSSMNKDHPTINHQYDVWQLSKWVVKKFTNKAKQKGCGELSPWIQSIANHLWWSDATCNGSVDLLREKWKSVLYIIGQGTPLFTSAVTGAFHPLKLSESAGSNQVLRSLSFGGSGPKQ